VAEHAQGLFQQNEDSAGLGGMRQVAVRDQLVDQGALPGDAILGDGHQRGLAQVRHGNMPLRQWGRHFNRQPTRQVLRWVPSMARVCSFNPSAAGKSSGTQEWDAPSGVGDLDAGPRAAASEGPSRHKLGHPVRVG
jgi:hypothetical protein